MTKNIELAILKGCETESQQLCKIGEEFGEVIQAYREYQRTGKENHLKEELIDLMQASFTLLRKIGYTDEDNVEHLRKMEIYKVTKNYWGGQNEN